MKARSIIKPLRPDRTHWRGPFSPGAAVRNMGYPAELWLYADGKITLSVISAVEVTDDNDGISRGPEYHVSIAERVPTGPIRCDSVTAAWALDQFGLVGAEEDNHVQHGVVRNFWRTVAEPLIGLDCACKATEPRIFENKGDFIVRPA